MSTISVYISDYIDTTKFRVVDPVRWSAYRPHAEAALLRAYRLANPRSRATSLIIYVRNGASVAQRGCVLCGECGPSWCARFPKTKRAAQWESTHECWNDPAKLDDLLLVADVVGMPLALVARSEVAA